MKREGDGGVSEVVIFEWLGRISEAHDMWSESWMKCGTSHVSIWGKNILGRVRSPDLPPKAHSKTFPLIQGTVYKKGRVSTPHTSWIPFISQGSEKLSSCSQVGPSTLCPSPKSRASISRSISKWSPVNFTLWQMSFQTSRTSRYICYLVGGREQHLSHSFRSSKKQEENTNNIVIDYLAILCVIKMFWSLIDNSLGKMQN